MFRAETPKLNDPDIKALVAKYPPAPNIDKLMSRLKREDSSDDDDISIIEESKHDLSGLEGGGTFSIDKTAPAANNENTTLANLLAGISKANEK